MSEIIIINCCGEELDEKIKSYLSSFVDREKLLKIESMRFSSDSKLRLYTHYIVGAYLEQKRMCKRGEIKYSYGKNGKPYVKGSNIKFNVSHSKNSLAVLFSSNDVGVDIESRRNVDLDIAKRYFTHSEQEYIFSEKNNVQRFLYIWTRKESYLKYTGDGIFKKMCDIDVLSKQVGDITQTFVLGDSVVSATCSDAILNKHIFTEKQFLTLVRNHITEN